MNRVSCVTHPAYLTMLMWYMGVRVDDAKFAQLIAYNDLIKSDPCPWYLDPEAEAGA